MTVALAPLILLAMQAAAPPQGAPTRQQMFDSATEAMDAGKCEEAVQTFAALEANRTGKTNAAVDAVIRARKGRCLLQLGRMEEGEAALRSGMEVLTPRGDAYRSDVRDGEITLGRLALQQFDYAGAEDHFRKGLALSRDAERIEVLALLSRVTMFDEGSAAVANMDEAVALAEKFFPTDKNAMAAIHTSRARALLNQKREKDAYQELRDALKLQGGLDFRVTLADIVTRSDLALAALLTGDEDEARKYLAYTGAGRMEKSPFASARRIELPNCDETGLNPADRTVIEFRLGEDGAVKSAFPIYSTGGRDAAVEFARSVSTWSWTPESAAAIPELFRYATRVELRCSRVGDARPPLNILGEAFAAWLKTRGLDPIDIAASSARTVPDARAALARAEAAKDSAAKTQALVALGTNAVLPPEEREEFLRQAGDAAAAAGAPIGVRTYLALIALEHGGEAWTNTEDYRRALRAMLADPAVAADPYAGGVVRVQLARRVGKARPPADADALLVAVADDPRLSADDPLRVAALLEQTTRATEAGRIDLARAAFERTGLDEQQCALVGLRPAMKRNGASSADYPMEAMRWGFEGWVRTEFDVMADGRTANQRAVIAYPPFVFADAGTGIAKDMRFEASYRPSGGAACSGSGEVIQFMLPRPPSRGKAPG